MSSLRELGRDLLHFFGSVLLRWINAVGCAAITFTQVLYPKLTISKEFPQGREFPVSSWWILGGCLCLAIFLAWRAERQKVKCKSLRAVLTKVVDASPYITLYQGGSGNVTAVLETIGALISACDEFGDESDVEWVCGQLTALKEPDRADPFDLYEYFYGAGSFKGKRLKFLRDARVTSGKYIKNDIDAIGYIRTFWGERNGLREVNEPIYPVKVVDGLLEYQQVLCRPLSSAKEARLYLFPPTIEVDGEDLPVSTPHVLPVLQSPQEIETHAGDDFATLVVPARSGCIPGATK